LRHHPGPVFCTFYANAVSPSHDDSALPKDPSSYFSWHRAGSLVRSFSTSNGPGRRFLATLVAFTAPKGFASFWGLFFYDPTAWKNLGIGHAGRWKRSPWSRWGGGRKGEKGGVESALRTLKRLVLRDGILRELKRKQNYEKPGERKRRKIREATRRRRRQLSRAL